MAWIQAKLCSIISTKLLSVMMWFFWFASLVLPPNLCTECRQETLIQISFLPVGEVNADNIII